MSEAYRLFDRRCRTETALAKLARLRRRVRRFKKVSQTLRKLFSPTLEKALTFLDDSLLAATSNAVERGNRRHRKMQKNVYRVRTRQRIIERVALDMHREAHAPSRTRTTTALHLARTGCTERPTRRAEPARQPLCTWPEQDNRSVTMLQSPKGHGKNDNPKQTDAGPRRRRGSLRARPPIAARPDIALKVRLFKD